MRFLTLLVGLLFSLQAGAAAVAAAKVKLVPLITAGIRQPVDVQVSPEESDRLYIVEQRGVISVLESGKLARGAFLDIVEKVTAGGEMGLLGLAFHPKFATNHRYFVNYNTRRPKLTTVISEFQAGTKQEKELITFDQPYVNHKGGQLAFDRQGYLYIATGDGGSAGDPHGNGQNKSAWLGKLLRIDVDRPGGDLPYGIPADNPFLHGEGRKEVFAYGLRNPWRFSFDRLTGAIFAGDVGQDRFEEIDIVAKGGNYGWNILEGNHCFSPRKGCSLAGLTMPIYEYGRAEGDCIIGGYVYRGKAIPALQGVYVYGDYDSGKIWGLTYDQTAHKLIGNELLLKTDLPISSFGQDSHGEILVVSLAGAIYRLSPAP